MTLCLPKTPSACEEPPMAGCQCHQHTISEPVSRGTFSLEEDRGSVWMRHGWTTTDAASCGRCRDQRSGGAPFVVVV
jgi:hypothetical protein